MREEKNMPRIYQISLNRAEKNFIDFCRKVKFCELTITILDGVPKKGVKAMKSMRFDLTSIIDENN